MAGGPWEASVLYRQGQRQRPQRCPPHMPTPLPGHAPSDPAPAPCLQEAAGLVAVVHLRVDHARAGRHELHAPPAQRLVVAHRVLHAPRGGRRGGGAPVSSASSRCTPVLACPQQHGCTRPLRGSAQAAARGPTLCDSSPCSTYEKISASLWGCELRAPAGLGGGWVSTRAESAGLLAR